MGVSTPAQPKRQAHANHSAPDPDTFQYNTYICLSLSIQLVHSDGHDTVYTVGGVFPAEASSTFRRLLKGVSVLEENRA